MNDAEQNSLFVVDDDIELTDMLSAFFGAQGYEVMSAAWGEEAVPRIQEALPDVVLLDIHLPDIDGYEVCRQLRQVRRTRHLPIIFLTSRREQKDVLAGLELGAVDYITKPFDIQELNLRVRNAMRRSRMHGPHNPITQLPEGLLVKEQLEAFLKQPDWGIVFASVRGLDDFRDRYGFVAADDVLRAVSLMIGGVAREEDGAQVFVGHSDVQNFVILTQAGRCRQMAARCRARLEPSIQYFYPASARTDVGELSDANRLSVQVACLRAQDGDFRSVKDVGEALHTRLT
jgi:PleD family two-component response regulator